MASPNNSFLFRDRLLDEPFNSPIYNGSGTDELDNFCIQTLQALATLEKTRQIEPLSIDSLVRVDISLVLGSDQTLQYYVNEISQFPCSLMDHFLQQTTQIELMASCVKEGIINTYLHYCLMYLFLPQMHGI